jgi:hypothetical protein
MIFDMQRGCFRVYRWSSSKSFSTNCVYAIEFGTWFTALLLAECCIVVCSFYFACLSIECWLYSVGYERYNMTALEVPKSWMQVRLHCWINVIQLVEALMRDYCVIPLTSMPPYLRPRLCNIWCSSSFRHKHQGWMYPWKIPSDCSATRNRYSSVLHDATTIHT